MTLHGLIEKAKVKQVEQKQPNSEKVQAFLEKIREIRKQQFK